MPEAEERITEAELEVMRALWTAGEPQTLGQLKEALARRLDWNGDTTKTLLRRLCQKGAVGQEKREVYYYRPLVSEGEFGRYRTQKLIDKLYAGSARALVASLVEHDQLKGEDVAELRAMFDALWEERGGET